MTTATFGGEFDGTADIAAPCPWKGLESYEPSDGAVFVGRERVVRQLLEAMERAPLAGVVGASGSGKSSLLLAGLSQHARHVVTVRPGSDPLAARLAIEHGLDHELDHEFDRGLDQGLDQAETSGPGGRPLVIVDQLEEVFTSCDDDADRAAFLDALVSLAESGRAGVVVALRSDHYGSCAPYPRFADALSRAHVLLGAPSHDELRRMITVPAEAAIVDIRMPPTHTDEGVRAARRIRRELPDIAVLLLSQYLDTALALRLIESNDRGTGYLLKERVTDEAELVDALERLAAGDTVVDPGLVDDLVADGPRRDAVATLTPRELAVLELVAAGLKDRAIADRLLLGTKTVEAHIAAIFRKFGLESNPHDNRRVHAVLRYLERRSTATPDE